MIEVLLEIAPDRLLLQRAGQPVASLLGGIRALLRPGVSWPRPLDIEEAIERAEDWLMPIATDLQGSGMVIKDPSWLLASQLGHGHSYSLEDIERLFNRLVSEVEAGVRHEAQGVAGMVLLRELFHHGRLVSVVIAQPPSNLSEAGTERG